MNWVLFIAENLERLVILTGVLVLGVLYLGTPKCPKCKSRLSVKTDVIGWARCTFCHLRKFRSLPGWEPY